eukprot:gb/GECH01002937.1/.p1 GENE.gb/GECH01002937.1/~~gb/GECH01002937.1/.p1  ORF type:complete len:402 (+),score=98.34 gb/GECH01002937.1/:1-1206(+)
MDQPTYEYSHPVSPSPRGPPSPRPSSPRRRNNYHRSAEDDMSPPTPPPYPKRPSSATGYERHAQDQSYSNGRRRHRRPSPLNLEESVPDQSTSNSKHREEPKGRRSPRIKGYPKGDGQIDHSSPQRRSPRPHSAQGSSADRRKRTSPHSNNNNNNSHHSDPCICEICTCGRHRCPVHPKVSEFNDSSTYRNTYKGWRPDPPKPPQPAAKPQKKPFDRNHFATMHRKNYAAFDPEMYRKPPPSEPSPPGRPSKFNDSTTYRQDYPAKKGGPAKPVSSTQPKMTKPSNYPTGTTMHRTEYQPWSPTKEKPIRHGENKLFTDQPQDMDTMYNKTYKPHKVSPPRPMKAAHEYKRGPPRNLSTMYRDEYTPKEMDVCPAIGLPRDRPPTPRGHIRFTKTSEGQFV